MPIIHDPFNYPAGPAKKNITDAVNLWWSNLSSAQKEFIEKWAKDRAMWTFPHSDWIVRMYYVSWEYMVDYPE